MNTMNTKYLIPILLLVAFVTGAHTQKSESTDPLTEESADNPIYKLYPTANNYTFIKLDTRNGKMWQVHFAIDDDASRVELQLNTIPLVDVESQKAGRFTIHKTFNMYNFLLLDQVNGKVTQVQWSMERMNRGIMNEIKPLD